MPPGLKRFQQDGDTHFLTFSCKSRNAYLRDCDGEVVLRWLERLHRERGFLVCGYALMPEHVHLLLTEPTKGSLAEMLSVLKAQIARQLKGDLGHFWEARYYDFNVFTEHKRVEKLRYLHRNPVMRGLVSRPEDYAWSSYRHYARGAASIVEIESTWTSAWHQRSRLREGMTAHPSSTTLSGAPGAGSASH